MFELAALLFGWSGETWTIIILVTLVVLFGVIVISDDSDWFA